RSSRPGSSAGSVIVVGGESLSWFCICIIGRVRICFRCQYWPPRTDTDNQSRTRLTLQRAFARHAHHSGTEDIQARVPFPLLGALCSSVVKGNPRCNTKSPN